jgi:hypothetical protein
MPVSPDSTLPAAMGVRHLVIPQGEEGTRKGQAGHQPEQLPTRARLSQGTYNVIEVVRVHCSSFHVLHEA